MRNWNDESANVSQLSSKSSSQKLSETEQATMTSKPILAELDLSQAKYCEKNKDLSGSTSTDPTTLSAPAPFDQAATKKLLRKLDLNLIPFLAFLYLYQP
jgi:hypothetical protein